MKVLVLFTLLPLCLFTTRAQSISGTQSDPIYANKNVMYFLEAIENGNADNIKKYYLKNKKKEIRVDTFNTKDGYKPLELMMRKGNAEAVQYLLENGVLASSINSSIPDMTNFGPIKDSDSEYLIKITRHMDWIFNEYNSIKNGQKEIVWDSLTTLGSVIDRKPYSNILIFSDREEITNFIEKNKQSLAKLDVQDFLDSLSTAQKSLNLLLKIYKFKQDHFKYWTVLDDETRRAFTNELNKHLEETLCSLINGDAQQIQVLPSSYGSIFKLNDLAKNIESTYTLTDDYVQFAKREYLKKDPVSLVKFDRLVASQNLNCYKAIISKIYVKKIDILINSEKELKNQIAYIKTFEDIHKFRLEALRYTYSTESIRNIIILLNQKRDELYNSRIHILEKQYMEFQEQLNFLMVSGLAGNTLNTTKITYNSAFTYSTSQTTPSSQSKTYYGTPLQIANSQMMDQAISAFVGLAALFVNHAIQVKELNARFIRSINNLNIQRELFWAAYNNNSLTPEQTKLYFDALAEKDVCSIQYFTLDTEAFHARMRETGEKDYGNCYRMLEAIAKGKYLYKDYIMERNAMEFLFINPKSPMHSENPFFNGFGHIVYNQYESNFEEAVHNVDKLLGILNPIGYEEFISSWNSRLRSNPDYRVNYLVAQRMNILENAINRILLTDELTLDHFTFQSTINGELVSSNDIAKKGLILIFIETTMSEWPEEIDKVDRLHKKYASLGYPVIMIHVPQLDEVFKYLNPEFHSLKVTNLNTAFNRKIPGYGSRICVFEPTDINLKLVYAGEFETFNICSEIMDNIIVNEKLSVNHVFKYYPIIQSE